MSTDREQRQEELIEQGFENSDLAYMMESESDGEPDPDTDPRYAMAKDLREGGVGVKETCKRAGISMSTYYAWFPSHDRGMVKQVQLEMIADIKAKRDDHWSDAAIARHHKRTRQWVWAMAGPRSKGGPNQKTRFNWVTTVETLHRVERIARSLGAANEERIANVGTMLDMIANGQLVVKAPPRPSPRRKADDGARAFGQSRASRSKT